MERCSVQSGYVSNVDSAQMNCDEALALLPLGVYRTDPEGKIEYANSALAELLGYTDAASVKEDKSPRFYVDLNDRRKWQEELQSSPSGKLIGFRTNWRRLDGRRIEV